MTNLWTGRTYSARVNEASPFTSLGRRRSCCACAKGKLLSRFGWEYEMDGENVPSKVREVAGARKPTGAESTLRSKGNDNEQQVTLGLVRKFPVVR